MVAKRITAQRSNLLPLVFSFPPHPTLIFSPTPPTSSAITTPLALDAEIAALLQRSAGRLQTRIFVSLHPRHRPQSAPVYVMIEGFAAATGWLDVGELAGGSGVPAGLAIFRSTEITFCR